MSGSMTGSASRPKLPKRRRFIRRYRSSIVPKGSNTAFEMDVFGAR